MSRTTPSLPVVAAAFAAAAAIAACGSQSPSSSSASSSASASSSSAHLSYAQATRDAVAFAGCVRTHGVPSFPDPASPRDLKASVDSSIARSPAFQAAATACRHLLPGGGPRNRSTARSPAQIASEVAFARCLRRHGFPNFPDPTSSGELSHEMLANAGIDIHQPAVVQAADACVGVTHGLLTKADVARFVAGQ